MSPIKGSIPKQPRQAAQRPPRSNRPARVGGLGLGPKLLLGAALVAVLPLLAVTAVNTAASLRASEAALLGAAQRQLASVRDSQERQITRYVQLVQDNSSLLARNAQVIAAMKDFSQAYGSLAQDAGGKPLSPEALANRRAALRQFYSRFAQQYAAANPGQNFPAADAVASLGANSVALQYTWVVNNPSQNDRSRMLTAPGGGSYSAAHARHQRQLRDLAQSLGFLDIHLVEPKGGTLIFTTEKQPDIGFSLLQGPLAQTPMAEAYAKAQIAPFTRSVTLSNLAPYWPALGETSLFAAAPIYDGNTLLGYLTVEVPVETLDAVVSNDNNWEALGLGQTGESRLINLDNGIRLTNDREFAADPKAFLAGLRQDGVAAQTVAAIQAKNNTGGFVANDPAETQKIRDEGLGVYTARDGDLVAFAALDLPGLSWALVTDQNPGEVLAPVAALRQDALVRTTALVLLTLLAVAVLTLLFVRSITGPLGQMLRVVFRVGQGDLSELVPVRSSDEIGALGNALNQSIQRLRGLVQTEQERDQERQHREELQANVGRFLDVANQIAQGDLTRRGEVTADILGNVVDAVNVTVEEIAYLLKDVRVVADSVGRSATQMDGLTQSIAQGTQAQAGEVAQVRQQTQAVAENIRQMADSAGATATSAQQTLRSAQAGRAAVTETLSGMNDIRMEMQGIAQTIEGLSARSAEIEAVARTLEDFASQTNLLALNASFEAAGAGAAGRRFAVVAEEIRKLAEESSRETARVGALVQGVQGDILTVVAQVKDGVREVETGYKVASTAGERLAEIAGLAEQSSGLAEQISGLAQGQVSVVERVDAAVQRIARASQTAEQESSQGREAAEAMRKLVAQLQGNLGRFQLPQ